MLRGMEEWLCRCWERDGGVVVSVLGELVGVWRSGCVGAGRVGRDLEEWLCRCWDLGELVGCWEMTRMRGVWCWERTRMAWSLVLGEDKDGVELGRDGASVLGEEKDGGVVLGEDKEVGAGGVVLGEDKDGGVERRCWERTSRCWERSGAGRGGAGRGQGWRSGLRRNGGVVLGEDKDGGVEVLGELVLVGESVLGESVLGESVLFLHGHCSQKCFCEQ